jgi:phosphomannomutase/phosphoglucomutase
VSIYKSCSVRGRVESELSPELYRRWGCALGMQLPEGAKYVVGGDVRLSTPGYLSALMEGLCRAGLDVVDVGILPTPMIHHARLRLRAGGCAIVTASRHPATDNGLQWMLDGRLPGPRDVEAMRSAAESPLTETGRPETVPRPLDVSFDYVANLQETWVEAMGSSLHVVLDPMHGGWSGKARRYLHAIFPQCLFTTIHDESDGRFDGHAPDCSNHGLLHELSETVYRERADLGVAFDGDGGRLALVDNLGVPLNPEEAACVLWETFPEARRQGRPFVYDPRFSDRLPERAKILGAEPVIERSGEAFLHARMIESGALFGAELSGRYFYEALKGGNDGLYSACRVIALLGRCGRSLADWRRRCPAVYMTPDLCLAASPAAQPAILEGLRTAWAGFPQRMFDGLRIDTPAGRIMVRASEADAALCFRFESLDWPALDDLVDRFCRTLPELGDKLREEYSAAMTTAGEPSTSF